MAFPTIKAGLAASIGLAAASTANAALISVQFEGNGGLPINTTAGLIPSTVWNSFGGSDNGNPPAATPLKDDSGNSDAATFGFSAGGAWQSTPQNGSTQPNRTDGNSQLFYGATGPNESFTVNGLSTANTYNVIVYLNGINDNGPNNMTPTTSKQAVTLDGTTFYGSFTSDTQWTLDSSDSSYTFTGLTGTGGTLFSQITQTTNDGTYQEGNYIELLGVSGPTITFTSSSGGAQPTIAGFQIQSVSAVPEPASLGLASLGLMSFLRRRRRGR